jgi:hypothetical protein
MIFDPVLLRCRCCNCNSRVSAISRAAFYGIALVDVARVLSRGGVTTVGMVGIGCGFDGGIRLWEVFPGFVFFACVVEVSMLVVAHPGACVV